MEYQPHGRETEGFAKQDKPSQVILILSFDCATGTRLTKGKCPQMSCD